MARIRTIKPEFWTSEQIVECSPIARLLFIGMWNFCDDGGNHPASHKTLKMQIFPGDDISISLIESIVCELLRAGLISEYTANGRQYWNVTGWKHQKIERPSYKYPQPFADNSPNDRREIDALHPPEGKGREGKGEDVSSSIGGDGEFFDSLEEQERKRQAEMDSRMMVNMTHVWIPDAKTLDDHLKYLTTRAVVNGKLVTSADLTDEILADFRASAHRKQERRTMHDWHGGLASYLVSRIRNPSTTSTPNAPKNGHAGGTSRYIEEPLDYPIAKPDENLHKGPVNRELAKQSFEKIKNELQDEGSPY